MTHPTLRQFTNLPGNCGAGGYAFSTVVLSLPAHLKATLSMELTMSYPRSLLAMLLLCLLTVGNVWAAPT
ncbi:hypothetical protein, partial [Pseudomonas sp. HMWF021]|uniref:hypothetical protein n=1 Tax=Pseudomonas sp. HMWF021 TaxID=2056857 RepID=UPI001C460416